MSSPESVGKFKREMDGQFPGRPIGAPVAPQPPADFAKANRRKRCGQCDACKVKENCNTCKNCINRKILKQTCILRRCHFLHHKPSPSAENNERKRKSRTVTPRKKPEERAVEPKEEEEEEPTAQPEEPNISSSDEIEQAVNSLLEDSNMFTHSEEEAQIPDKIFPSQPPIISKLSPSARKSFPESSEVLRSSTLLKKQNESSGVSFKIVPSNGSTLRPSQFPPPLMIVNPQPIPKYEIPRHNFVFARMPSSQPLLRPPPEEFPPSSSPMLSAPLQPSSSFDFPTPKVHRRKRCGQCRPCLIKENCMKCKNCINRKVLKQTCIHRKCLYLREKIKKESGFCSSPIVDPPPQSSQFQIYDTPLSTPQHIQLQPTVFIAEHYDQPRFRPVIQPKHPEMPGRVNFIPQGHVIHPGQHIQLWQNSYPGSGFPQALPVIATPQGNYTVQLRPQTQYVQTINPHDGQPRYYVHPSVTHINALPDFTPMNRLPTMAPRPASLPHLKVEATDSVANDVRDPASS